MNTDKIYAERIADEYTEKETSKVKALKKLDEKVKSPANIFAFTFGIISSLILGTGMCLAMEQLGSGLTTIIIGIVVGCIGIFGVSINYFLYKKILKKAKNKYANDIITLANQIISEE